MPIMSAKEMNEEKRLLEKRKLAEQIEEMLVLCAELAEKMGVDVSSFKVPKKKIVVSTGEEKMSSLSEISTKMGAQDPQLENKNHVQEMGHERDHDGKGIGAKIVNNEESPSAENSGALEPEDVEFCPETVMGDEITSPSLGVSSAVSSKCPVSVPPENVLSGLSSTYSVSNGALPPTDHLPTRRMSVPPACSTATVDVSRFEELDNHYVTSPPPTPGWFPGNLRSEAEANERLLRKCSLDNSAVGAENDALEERHKAVQLEIAPTKGQVTNSNSCSESRRNDAGSSPDSISRTISGKVCQNVGSTQVEYERNAMSEAAPFRLLHTSATGTGFRKRAVDLVKAQLECVTQVVGCLLKICPVSWKNDFDHWRNIGSHDLFRISWHGSVDYRLELSKDFKKRKKRLRGKKI